MAWSADTWVEAGSWYAEYGVVASEQASASTSGTGGLEIEGAVSTGVGQSAALIGAMELSSTSWETGQAGATTAAVAAIEIAAAAELGQGAATTDGVGGLAIDGHAATSQGSSVRGRLNQDNDLIADVVTEQGRQGVRALGAITIPGAITTGQTQSVSAQAGIEISGVVRTCQAQTSRTFGIDHVNSNWAALQRMLKHPHGAVFDKSAYAQDAIRFVYPGGLTWSIEGGRLNIEFGSEKPSFGLAGKSIVELAQELISIGIDVSVNPAFLNLSTAVLIESDGKNENDPILGFTSILWALLTSYSFEVDEVERQVAEALRQMVIPQAEGYWLDVWGTLYGDGRKPNETDGSYAPRIPQEAFRERVNARGIEKAIRDATRYDVRIEEPWENIFRLDESLLSGPDKFYDGDYIGYHLIQPTSLQEVDWSVVLPLIERNKAAGVIVLAPVVRHRSYVRADGETVVHAGLTRTKETFSRYEDRALLDYSLVLDNNSGIIVNHDFLPRREIAHRVNVVVPDEYVVHSRSGRDYRGSATHVQYRGQDWTGRRSWATAQDTWVGLTVLVDTAHSRS